MSENCLGNIPLQPLASLFTSLITATTLGTHLFSKKFDYILVDFHSSMCGHRVRCRFNVHVSEQEAIQEPIKRGSGEDQNEQILQDSQMDCFHLLVH